jgi:vacuolar-type H+-ATPase subunit H
MNGGIMEILNLIDRLETAVSSSARLPATRKIVLDADRMLELVDQMRLAMPRDMQDVQELMAKREAIINQALLESRRIKSSAETESRKQIDESEIVQKANQLADEIVSEAKRRGDAMLQDSQRQAHQVTQEAQAIQEGTMKDCTQYSFEVLSRLEQQLSSVLNSVRLGLDSIGEREKIEAD